MSTRNPTHGTKVTDSNAPQIHEGAGFVAKDSLAAESSDFQEANRNGEPLGVTGANSTFANSNTSGAIKIEPAKDRESRGSRNDEETSRGVRGEERGLGDGNGRQGGGSAVDEAPSYVNSQFVDSKGPKGKGLKEDGDLHGKNASFNNEIGTKNDPGRLAEEAFQKANADGREQAGFPKQSGAGDENQYGTLKDTSA